MSKVIETLERAQVRGDIPQFKAGDTVRVHFKVIEGQRQRIQVFEGIVLKRQGAGARETFTVRKQSFGVGVERTFPLHTPKIERIEVVSVGDVNRAKLYYLRGKVGKKARIRELRQDTARTSQPQPTEPETTQPEPAEPEAQVDTPVEGEAEAAEPEGVEAEAAESEAAAAEAQPETSTVSAETKS